MIIGVDLRCLPSDGSPGAGIAHASKALVNKLIAKPVTGVAWTLFLPRGAVPHAEGRLLREKTAETKIVRIENAGGAALRRALKRYPCDILFVPSGAIPPGIRMPVVPWVHDIAIFDHPEWFPQPIVRRTVSTRLFRRGVERSVSVLAVSEFTKNELAGHFGVDPGRITVTFEGGDDLLSSLSGEALAEHKRRARRRIAERGVTNRYILCMGTLEPRKNVSMLLNAWAEARPGFTHAVDLVIAGRDGWKLGPITKALDAAKTYAPEGGSRLHRIEAPNDDDRRDLLLGAGLVVVPSLYEGFGLVALEGMQAGTAVLSARAGALPEVVGEDGILLPPEDPEAWKDAMSSLMNDDAGRQALAERGKARSQGMTWERSASIAFRVLTGREG